MNIFRRKAAKIRHKMPPWEEVVQTMKGKGLNFTQGYKVADVLYSPDNTHRFVILESDDDYLTYIFESLFRQDEDEQYYYGDEAAYWQSKDLGAKPVFNDINILLRELKATPEYKIFFDGGKDND